MRFAVALLLSILCVTSPAQTPAPASSSVLTLLYQERPPYSATLPDGSVKGLVADPAAGALRRAGIPFRWSLTPSQRQLAMVQSGTGLQCGIGWFRNPARAAKGQFSAALYQDRPLAALVRTGSTDIASTTAVALLANRTLRLLVKDGYSYGPQLDALIVAAARTPVRTAVEPQQMSLMLVSGRADWMIVSPEEADVLLQQGLHLARLTDAQDGPTRHLYCSGDVPADWMARIDEALRAGQR
jgi:polar amino acid transport system substrate-binding protein